MDSTGLGLGIVAGWCEQSNQASFLRDADLLDSLSDWQIFSKYLLNGASAIRNTILAINQINAQNLVS